MSRSTCMVNAADTNKTSIDSADLLSGLLMIVLLACFVGVCVLLKYLNGVLYSELFSYLDTHRS